MGWLRVSLPMTDSTKKKVEAATSIHAILGNVNNLIASRNLQLDIVGVRVRNKLLTIRKELQDIIDYWEKR